MRRRGRILSLLLLILILTPLSGENLRGGVAGILDLSQDSQTSQEYEIRAGEFLALIPGAKGDYLEAIQLAIQIPEGLRQYGESYVLLFYKRITPEPDAAVSSYQGLEAGNTVLPPRLRLYLELPVNGAARTPLTSPLGLRELPLMLNIISMSKAMPRALENTPFMVKVTPVWSNKGKAELIPSGDPVDPAEVTIWVDDRPVSLAEQPLLLSAGVHTVRAQAPGCREITKTFAVNQGQTVRVELPFARQLPALYFEAPEGTQIFLDGEKVISHSLTPLFITEGNHTVLFILEDYKISRQFHAAGSNDYKISLFLDILIQEY